VKVSYYPGCSLESTGRAYDGSARAVCAALGVELEEVADWVCCGSSAALKTSRRLSTALSAVNLALLERAGPPDVVAPCPFCYRRLASTQAELRGDAGLREDVQQLVEAELPGRVRIHDLVRFLRDEVGLAAIAARVQRPLRGLKVVPYYGCFMVKPRQVTGCEDSEAPTSLDELLSALGAEVLDWDLKTECCGASLSLSRTERVEALSGRIVREAAFRGADAVAVACQLCQSNLELRQGTIADGGGAPRKLPIVYFTQLMGLAFGLAPGALGLDHHLVDPLALLARKGLVA
jgi:heterodisulfide reductase subunit B